MRERRDLKRLGFEGSEEQQRMRAAEEVEGSRRTALREGKQRWFVDLREREYGFGLILVRRRRRLRAQVLKILAVASMAKLRRQSHGFI